MDQTSNPLTTKSMTLDLSITFPGPELLIHKIGVIIFMFTATVMTIKRHVNCIVQTNK